MVRQARGHGRLGRLRTLRSALTTTSAREPHGLSYVLVFIAESKSPLYCTSCALVVNPWSPSPAAGPSEKVGCVLSSNSIFHEMQVAFWASRRAGNWGSSSDPAPTAHHLVAASITHPGRQSRLAIFHPGLKHATPVDMMKLHFRLFHVRLKSSMSTVRAPLNLTTA
jgi:hypothetical protein